MCEISETHDTPARLVWLLEAAVALAAQLAEAVETRDVIGQAKGIVMAQRGLDARDAFALLVRQSQKTNTKVRVVAERVVATVLRDPDLAAQQVDRIAGLQQWGPDAAERTVGPEVVKGRGKGRQGAVAAQLGRPHGELP